MSHANRRSALAVLLALGLSLAAAPGAAESPSIPPAGPLREEAVQPGTALEPPAAAQPPDAPSEELPDVAAEELPDVAAGADDDDWLFDPPEDTPEASDTLEPGNRVIFAGNEFFYRWLADPISDVYGFLLPDAVQRSVRRFFANLGQPSTLVNHLLQGQLPLAGKTGARFLVNTTVGLAGFLDPATAWGIDPVQADFGETLAVYGVGKGPYLVIPLIGPATARDAVGRLVDAALSPDTWLLGFGTQFFLVTGGGLSDYHAQKLRLEELRKSSVDFYASVRGAYLMDRDARVQAAIERVRGAPAEIHPGVIVVVARREPRWGHHRHSSRSGRGSEVAARRW